MFQAIQLSCVRNEQILFSHVNFSLAAGEVLQIIGPNGSGKTSLLRILCGLLTPEEGKILWRDQNIVENNESFLSELIYIGHKHAIHAHLTTHENIKMMMALKSKDQNLDIKTILTKSGLITEEHKFAFQLSAGQKQRLNLSRLYDPNGILWLLDEPLTALDQTWVRHLAQQIEEHARRGGIVVFSSHQAVPLTIETKTIQLDSFRG